MEKTNANVIIIGAGLTGLSLAYFLQKNGIDATLIEARERIGGRILTQQSNDVPPTELGATWFGQEHQQLIHLMKELGVAGFDQLLGNKAIYEAFSTAPFQTIDLPKQEQVSQRIQGGTQQLISALADKFDAKKIHLNQPVTSIEKRGNEVVVKTATTIFTGKCVVSTLPPLLLQHTIKIQPSLPNEVLEIAKQTHTWMGESIKVSFSYKAPFWNSEGVSGTIFSNVGPISEMYDHSNSENTQFALTGFFNGSYHSVSSDERKNLALNQLRKYYGDRVTDFLAYSELVWKKEPFTSVESSSNIFPHQHNGHAVYQQSFLEGAFYIAGTETSSVYPGYMEGAICSAQAVCAKILQEHS